MTNLSVSRSKRSFSDCTGFDFESVDLVLEYVDGGDLLDYIIARSGLRGFSSFVP